MLSESLDGMIEASIIFRENDDGVVEMSVDLPPNALSHAAMCAFCLAKRGLTKREAERYGYPGYFHLEPRPPEDRTP